MGALQLDVLGTSVADDGSQVSAALRWTLRMRDGSAPTGLSLVVLARTTAGWRIVQDASM